MFIVSGNKTAYKRKNSMDNLLNNGLKVKLASFNNLMQMELFQNLEESMVTPDEDQKAFIRQYALIVECGAVPTVQASLTGRPMSFRRNILKLFFLKAFKNLPTTKAARDLVRSSYTWRRVCGFESTREIPSEATLSRAFAEFSGCGLIGAIHKAILRKCIKDTKTILHNVSGDSTEIVARERGVEKAKAEKPRPKGRRGRRPAAEKRNTPPPEPSNLERQAASPLEENLSGIPRECNWGCKANSKGTVERWRGYKLHIDASDCGVVTSALLSSASMHDSQAAIPLMQMTAENTFFHFHDLMDAAYDSTHIMEFSRSLGQVPVIDPNRRNGPARELDPASRARYKCRTAVERVNSELKDSYGARNVMVRGAAKVFTHLMFGVVLVTVKHLLIMLC